jgi:hypothetical protein
MGTVYMAEQTERLRRTVALKLIKAGMDSRLVLARFGAEPQTLALIDHPHIAKVFDAGTTDTGRPYFLMEMVKGIPITKFCDERRLTTRQRLELAIPVCHAVQHAHQKGIIHCYLDDEPVAAGPPTADSKAFQTALGMYESLASSPCPPSYFHEPPRWSIPAASGRRAWRCVRVVPCSSCPALATSSTTTRGRPDSGSPARLLAAATVRCVLLRN